MHPAHDQRCGVSTAPKKLWLRRPLRPSSRETPQQGGAARRAPCACAPRHAFALRRSSRSPGSQSRRRAPAAVYSGAAPARRQRRTAPQESPRRGATRPRWQRRPLAQARTPRCGGVRRALWRGAAVRGHTHRASAPTGKPSALARSGKSSGRGCQHAGRTADQRQLCEGRGGQLYACHLYRMLPVACTWWSTLPRAAHCVRVCPLRLRRRTSSCHTTCS